MIRSLRNITLYLSLLILLTNCVPAALLVGAVGGATVGGAVIYDKRNTAGILDDNSISKKINYKIAHDFMLRSISRVTRIKINVFNRVVLLVGEVPNEYVRQRVYGEAMSVRDVKRVYNQLEVRAPISVVQQSNDTFITSKIKSVMVATQNLHSTQIKVVTENKIVYLMGIVTHAQARLAADTASHVKGVVKVIEVFEYEE